MNAIVLALLVVLAPSLAAGQQPASPEARLKALGIQLPAVPKPIASYVPAVRAGNLIFLAGQGPVVDGKPTVTGKVGAELSEADGYKAARATILTSLAVLRGEIGSLDRVRRIVKLVGWVNSAPGFTRQPWVVNGASDLLGIRTHRERCLQDQHRNDGGHYAGEQFHVVPFNRTENC